MKKYPKRHPLHRITANLSGVTYHPWDSKIGKGNLGLFQGVFRNIDNERISKTFSIGRLGKEEACRQAEEYVLKGKFEYHAACIEIIKEELKKNKKIK